MAEWHFCEECGHCFLAMDYRQKYCSDGCYRAAYKRQCKECYQRNKEKNVVLGQVAKKIRTIQTKRLTPDRIEELRELADKLIDFCDEKEGIRFD